MAKRTAQTRPVSEQPRSSSISTLIVDDYLPWRRAISSLLLSRPDLQVVGEAGNGIEALQRVEELKPQLIVLDIGLPSISGIEVASRIRQISGNAKILFLSQDNDPVVVHMAMGSGALGYVLKFDAARQLLLAVTAVLQGYQFISSGVNYELGGVNPI